MNSRSEYNRCALPRMMCKLGDQSFKKNEEEMHNDLAREENQVKKIREMKKERNRERADISRIHGAAPGPKRRKITEEKYETEQKRETERVEKSEQEKRKESEPITPDNKKKRKLAHDIREMFEKQDIFIECQT